MKGGETLALNERIMLSLVSTGVSAYYPKNVYILTFQVIMEPAMQYKLVMAFTHLGLHILLKWRIIQEAGSAF